MRSTNKIKKERRRRERERERERARAMNKTEQGFKGNNSSIAHMPIAPQKSILDNLFLEIREQH